MNNPNLQELLDKKKQLLQKRGETMRNLKDVQREDRQLDQKGKIFTSGPTESHKKPFSDRNGTSNRREQQNDHHHHHRDNRDRDRRSRDYNQSKRSHHHRSRSRENSRDRHHHKRYRDQHDNRHQYRDSSLDRKRDYEDSRPRKLQSSVSNAVDYNKPKREESTRLVRTDSETLKLAQRDDEKYQQSFQKQRNRNMFANLLGHLGKAKSDLDNQKDILDKQDKQKQKVDQIDLEQTEALRENKKKELDRVIEQKRDANKQYDTDLAQIDHQIEVERINQQFQNKSHFLLTETQPPIYWTPAKMNMQLENKFQAVREKNQKQKEVQIEVLQEKLKQKLREIDEKYIKIREDDELKKQQKEQEQNNNNIQEENQQQKAQNNNQDDDEDEEVELNEDEELKNSEKELENKENQ